MSTCPQQHREQLSKLDGAWIQLLQAPTDDWRALQDIMQDESAKFEERANGFEIRRRRVSDEAA